jgi:hypothetical protein
MSLYGSETVFLSALFDTLSLLSQSYPLLGSPCRISGLLQNQRPPSPVTGSFPQMLVLESHRYALVG